MEGWRKEGRRGGIMEGKSGLVEEGVERRRKERNEDVS